MRNRITDAEIRRVFQLMRETGEPVAVCAKKLGMSYPTIYRRCAKNPKLREEYEEAKKVSEQNRIQVAWFTVESAMRQRDKDGNVTMQALKAALAILYSTGEIVDPRSRQTAVVEVPQGKVTVTFGALPHKSKGEEESGENGPGEAQNTGNGPDADGA